MSKEIEKEIDDFIANENASLESEINAFIDREDPSFEEKYLQPAYDIAGPVVKGLSVLGKPLSLAGAAGRSIGKYISGQENAVGPIKEELSTIFPTQEGNPLADLSMLEGANDPLVNVSDEFRYEAPKMASFIEEASSPSSLAQIGSDIALGSTGISSMGKSGAGKALAKSYKRRVADMYLNAIQKDPSLANALKSSGKWEDVIDFVASDKNLITPFSKQKALDYLEGPTTSTVDEFGIVRTSKDINKGLIGQRGAQAEQALASVRGDKIIDPVEMRFSAYGGLNRSMLDSQKSSAQKIIDDAIPQVDFDVNKLETLKKVDEYAPEYQDLSAKILEEQNILEDIIQKKKADEFSKLSGVPKAIPNPEYRQDLQWLSTLPVVESSEVFPKIRREYITNIDFPDDPDFIGVPGYQKRASQVIDSVDESFRSSDPSNLAFYGNKKMKDILSGKHLSPEFIDNPEFLKLNESIKNKMQVLNYEIDAVRNLRMDDVSNQGKLASLLKQRDDLTRFWEENFDTSLLKYGEKQSDAYKSMIQERGMLPAGFATDLRKQANKLIDDAKLTAVSNPVEAGSLHEAGLALHKAAAQAEMNIASQYLSPEEINQFMQAKRQQELALATRDLMDKNRLVKGNAGAYVPVGSLDRGLMREVLSAFPEKVAPISSNILDSVVNTAIPGISNVGSATYPLSQIQPEQKEVYRIPQSVKTDFLVQYEIPRSAQEILAQKDLVMAKIQSEVQDPQVLMMAQQMLDGLQKNPESVKPVLGQLANMMPQIFVKDKYNRFDGIVPMDMRPVAIEDIKQSDVSPAIKAQKINLLHNRGQLLD